MNKIDGCISPNYIGSEFYSLGLKQLNFIAASHGTGMEQLSKNIFLWYRNHEKEINQSYHLPDDQKITDYHKSEEDHNLKYRIQFAIVGRPNVGKSTLTNRILGETRVIVFNKPGTTRDCIYIPIEWQGIKYTLIDTAGVKKIYKITNFSEKIFLIKTLQIIKQVNVVVMVLDAHLGIHIQDSSLVNFITKSGRGIVLVVNKWDLLSCQEKNKFRDKLFSRWASIKIDRIHFISALSSPDKDIKVILHSVRKSYQDAIKDISSSVLSRILKNAIKEHKPPTICGRTVKMKYAHLGGKNPHLVVIHGNQLKEIPNSYKNYLVNYFRRALKIVGTPIRILFKESNNPFVKKHKNKSRK
ncbi:MAG: ribosome biogenesis GTPase Der [Candidatus Dasytiphilus stammeri]